jgi:hypothetical protein
MMVVLIRLLAAATASAGGSDERKEGCGTGSKEHQRKLFPLDRPSRCVPLLLESSKNQIRVG